MMMKLRLAFTCRTGVALALYGAALALGAGLNILPLR
jgi:hypothetical protein